MGGWVGCDEEKFKSKMYKTEAIVLVNENWILNEIDEATPARCAWMLKHLKKNYSWNTFMVIVQYSQSVVNEKCKSNEFVLLISSPLQ